MLADKPQRDSAGDIEELRSRLEDSEATLQAIRSGEVDALVVDGPNGNQIYTLQHAEHPYRVFFEAMLEGAVTLSDAGLILYSNYRFADMVKTPLEKVLGISIDRFLVPEDQRAFHNLLSRSKLSSSRAEMTVSASDGTSLPVLLALSPLTLDDNVTAICLVVTDLTVQKQREQEILLLQKELEQRVIERTAELRRANLQLQTEIEERIRVAEQLVTLQAVTTSFSASLSTQDVVDVFIGEGLGAIGAVSGAVFLLSDDNQVLKLIKSAGYSDELTWLFYRLPIYSTPQPLRDCLRTQQPVWYQPSEVFTNNAPFDIPLVPPDELWSVIPIKGDNRMMGLLLMGFAPTDHADDQKQRFILTVLAQCSQAFHRAFLYEQAQTTAATEERQRLARDLHDAVSQTLFSANIIAETLPRLAEQNPERAMKQLSEVSRLTRGALAEMRALLLELRPSALVNAKLSDLIYQLVNALQVKKRIDTTVALEENTPLPDDVHVGFYRILQEALNNVVKHSNAKAVTIRFHNHESRAELEVSDNGAGFDTESPKSGLGLGMMRERAQAIHADLQVNSAPGKGTTIKVFWTDSAGEETLLTG